MTVAALASRLVSSATAVWAADTRAAAAAAGGIADRARRADAVSARSVGRTRQAADGRHREAGTLSRSDRRDPRRRSVPDAERQPSATGAEEARRQDGDCARRARSGGRVQDPRAQYREGAQPPREIARDDPHGA